MRTLGCIMMVSLLVLCGCQKQQVEDISKADFPTQLRTKVELQRDRDGKGGKVRYVTLNEDKTKLVGVEIEFPDGNTEYEHYREDGTLRELVGFYPLPKDSKNDKRKPRRTVLYDADGKTVLFERTLREDGTAEVYKHSRQGGGMETETFYPDGKTIQVRTVRGARNELLVEEKYRPTGVLESQTRQVSYWDTEVVEFREDGTRQSVTIKSSTPYSPMTKTLFGRDGIMVVMKVTMTSYSIDVEYRRDDGTIAERRSYHKYASYLTVTVFGPDGKPQFRQDWNRPYGSDWMDHNNYKLTRVEELKPDGTVARDIELYDDGKTPKRVRIPDGNGYYTGKFRYFRPDGTLEKEEVKEDYDKVKETKDFKPEDNIRETIPDDFLKLSPKEKPDIKDLPEPPRYNYPYGYQGRYDGGCDCGDPSCPQGGCSCGDGCPGNQTWDD